MGSGPGMIKANQHSQGSASSQCHKPSEDQVEVSERDIALGMDCDRMVPTSIMFNSPAQIRSLDSQQKQIPMLLYSKG